MESKTDLKSLVQAVAQDEISLETAIELHIDDPSIDVNDICAALCYFSLGQLDRMVNVQTMRRIGDCRLAFIEAIR